MQFTTIILAALTTLAAAQSATAPSSPESSCQAQPIVDACRRGFQPQIDACKGNDWICLCDNYSALLTCFDNCPGTNERPPVQNQVTQFCLAAEPIKSASAAARATEGSAKAPAATSPGATATTSSPAWGTTGAPSAASATETTGAAGKMAMPAAGGLAALLMGVAGLL